MAWITITEADILTVLSADELDAYRAASIADDQPDPVAPTILQVTDVIRGYVGGNRANQLGATGIPSKLLAPALDLIAVRIPLRVGKTPKEGRKTAGEAAIKLLEQVAAGRFDIEEPLTPTSEVSAVGGRPTFSGRKRRNVRRESNGL